MTRTHILFLFASIILIIFGSAGTLTFGTESVVALNETNEKTPIDIETEKISINLHAQRTTVAHNETVIFVHSITNYITNEDELNVQLILETPSGSEVFSSAGTDAGSGNQYTTTATLTPGGQENLRIEVDLNEPGTYEITGEVVYFFGNKRSSGDGQEAKVQVEQLKPPPAASEEATDSLSTILDVIPNSHSWIVSALESQIKKGPSTLVGTTYAFAALFISSAYIVTIKKIFNSVGKTRSEPIEGNGEKLFLFLYIFPFILLIVDLLRAEFTTSGVELSNSTLLLVYYLSTLLVFGLVLIITILLIVAPWHFGAEHGRKMRDRLRNNR